MIRLRPISWLPRISIGLTIAQLSARPRCAECSGPLHSVKPWRLEDVLGNPLGRLGLNFDGCIIGEGTMLFTRLGYVVAVIALVMGTLSIIWEG
jgi:hypothetical protein